MRSNWQGLAAGLGLIVLALMLWAVTSIQNSAHSVSQPVPAARHRTPDTLPRKPPATGPTVPRPTGSELAQPSVKPAPIVPTPQVDPEAPALDVRPVVVAPEVIKPAVIPPKAVARVVPKPAAQPAVVDPVVVEPVVVEPVVVERAPTPARSQKLRATARRRQPAPAPAAPAAPDPWDQGDDDLWLEDVGLTLDIELATPAAPSPALSFPEPELTPSLSGGGAP